MNGLPETAGFLLQKTHFLCYRKIILLTILVL